MICVHHLQKSRSQRGLWLQALLDRCGEREGYRRAVEQGGEFQIE